MTKKGVPPKKGPLSSLSRSRPRKKTKDDSSFRLAIYGIGIASVIIFLSYYYVIRPYSYRWKPCYGYRAYGVCIPSGYTVHGIDVSRYQGIIRWEQLKSATEEKAPIGFVFMKATEGSDFKDIQFDTNFSNTASLGLLRGAYHFFNVNSSGSTQADFFIRTVPLGKGDLPPVVDVETKPKNVTRFQRELKLWLAKVEQHYGVKPIIYSSPKYYRRYLNDSLLHTYPYWIAHYYVDKVDGKISWTFWQHTDVGTLPGIEEQVDLNVFNGSYEELLEMTIP